VFLPLLFGRYTEPPRFEGINSREAFTLRRGWTDAISQAREFCQWSRLGV